MKRSAVMFIAIGGPKAHVTLSMTDTLFQQPASSASFRRSSISHRRLPTRNCSSTYNRRLFNSIVRLPLDLVTEIAQDACGVRGDEISGRDLGSRGYDLLRGIDPAIKPYEVLRLEKKKAARRTRLKTAG